MDKVTFLQFLDRYFEGTLLPEEKSAFYKAMEENKEYKVEFEMEQAIKNSVILFNRKKLRNKLKANRGKKLSTRFIGVIVSVAALLIIAVMVYVLKFSTPQEELLFSGVVKYSNYAERVNQYKIIESYERVVNSSGIKDLPISNQQERFRAKDSINKKIESLSYDLENKKIYVKIYYFEGKESYKINNDTIFIYFNSKELRSIDKIELGTLDTLKIFSNDKVFSINK